MRRPRTDEGFTMAETIVAIGIVATVMTSLAVFFTRSATVQHEQADTQVAAQIAASSMDYVSQLPGDNVLLGRTQAGVQTEWGQWSSPPAAVSYYLSRTQQAWQDPSLPASAGVQGLATTPESVQLTAGATSFQRWWFVGTCWQPRTGGDCTTVTSSTYVKMYRVFVVITWPSPNCAGNQCQYVSAMLTESDLTDPTWQ